MALHRNNIHTYTVHSTRYHIREWIRFSCVLFRCQHKNLPETHVHIEPRNGYQDLYQAHFARIYFILLWKSKHSIYLWWIIFVMNALWNLLMKFSNERDEEREKKTYTFKSWHRTTTKRSQVNNFDCKWIQIFTIL